jgi:hypothetical protein
MYKHIHFTSIVVLILAIGLTACGNKTGAVISPNQSSSLTGNSETGGEGGAEAALVTYSDSPQGFSIAYPQPWTQDKSVTAGVKFIGGDDSMTLEFVSPPVGTDAMAYAQGDVTNLAKLFPGFEEVGLAASTEVKNAIVLGFQATATSAVTGKDYTARGDRYYMPLADGRIAILTEIGPTSHYDREGVRDIALTFKLTK